MKLSIQDENLLVLALTEGLRDAVVRSYGYISFPRGWQENAYKSLEAELVERLRAKLDNGGLEALIQKELFTDFFDAGLKLPPKNEHKALVSYDLFSDPLKVARKLVAVISASPYQYTLFMEGPEALAEAFDRTDVDLQFRNQLRLVSGAVLAENLKRKDLSEAEAFFCVRYNDRFNDQQFDDKSLFFTFRAGGLLSDRYEPKMSSDFQDAVRSFYGVCLAADIFWGMLSSQNKCHPLVTAVRNEENRLVFSNEADDDVRRATNLYVSKEMKEKIARDGDPAKTFDLATRLFRSGENPRLATSSIWLLRAQMSGRSLDTVLESSIAIEVLLGDRDASDRVGLSKLMANRCAYSLGKTAEERRKLSEFFLKFYKVRSDIVHSGRYKLTANEQEVVAEGLTLASRLLVHEVSISTS